MQPRIATGIALYTEDEIANHDLIEPRTIARLEMWDEGVPAYSANIADAWELDSEGWTWTTCEFIDSYFDYGDKLEPWLAITAWFSSKTEMTLVKFSDFPTKAAAYAVARCRAWLKARRCAARPASVHPVHAGMIVQIKSKKEKNENRSSLW
jgi:hypothetical protein